MTERCICADTYANLTYYQIYILALIAKGLTTRQIAAKLDLGESTVRSYISRVMAKIGVSNRAEAAAYAIEHNLDDAAAFDDLTLQELAILALVAEGWTTRQIAVELFLGESTVRSHISRMIAKIGVSNRAEAAAYAAKYNIGVDFSSRSIHIGFFDTRNH